jgi:hypothetical protein
MKTRAELPHLYYPAATMQRRQINAHAFPGGGGAIGTSWKTATNATTTRSDYTAWVGGSFLVGASPITINGLARWKHSGNTGTRTVKITTTDGTLVATVDIDLTAHGAGDWAAEAITPVVLSASTRYILQSRETSGPDIWYEHHTPTVSSVAGSLWANFGSSGAATYADVQYLSGSIYVGLNFYYE